MTVELDWDSFGFSLTPTKTMFVATTKAGHSWEKGHLLPFGNLSLSPAACILNYGQGIFEGMKALKTQAGEFVLFRPRENARRFSQGAERFCMPAVPEEFFLRAIKKIVRENRDWITPYKKGSLYLRPCLWGTGPILGVAPAQEYSFVIYTSPVGRYFKSGLETIKVLVSDDVDRAAPRGTGDVKFIGNYAGTLASLQQAKANGFQGCIYLDAKTNQYIEEVGSANFFCVVDNTLITPKLGSILPGVTRDSVIRLARELLHLTVVETDITVQEANSASECFCVGTAAVVTPIGSITYRGKETVFHRHETGPLTRKIYDTLRQIQLCEREDVFNWVERVSMQDDAEDDMFFIKE